MTTIDQNGKKLLSKDNCGICGKPLIYQTNPVLMSCVYCGREYTANIYCSDGHYICDSCHEYEALEILRQVICSTTSDNPSEILEVIMSHPAVPMHGPEHHAMIPAVIIAAVKNAGYPIPDKAIEQAINRGSKIPGGWCGYYGACGAAIGVGIAVSIIGAATPLTGKPRSLALEATSYALSEVADGFPRCCKRASRMALEAAVSFLQDRMSIVLGKSNNITCDYSDRNLECPRDKCSYYTKN